MTNRQKRFVEEYLVDLNATQAAIRAGYSEKTARAQGQRMLTYVYIQQAVQEGQKTRSERVQVTQDWVLGRLVENVERSMQAEAVLNREGTPTGEYVYQGAVANKALELLGKHIGMFKADAPNGTHEVSVTHKRDELKDMTPAEIADLYRNIIRS